MVLYAYHLTVVHSDAFVKYRRAAFWLQGIGQDLFDVSSKCCSTFWTSQGLVMAINLALTSEHQMVWNELVFRWYQCWNYCLLIVLVQVFPLLGKRCLRCLVFAKAIELMLNGERSKRGGS